MYGILDSRSRAPQQNGCSVRELRVALPDIVPLSGGNISLCADDFSICLANRKQVFPFYLLVILANRRSCLRSC